MRVLENGDIIYPCKGTPPPVLVGYVRDPGNPFILRFNLPCRHRGNRYIKQVCGGKDIRYACLKKNCQVVLYQCFKCKEREE